MPGHASIQQAQRYLHMTDEELRRGLEMSWIGDRGNVVAGARNHLDLEFVWGRP